MAGGLRRIKLAKSAPSLMLPAFLRKAATTCDLAVTSSRRSARSGILTPPVIIGMMFASP